MWTRNIPREVLPAFSLAATHTLAEAFAQLRRMQNTNVTIPTLIRALENPASPIALPGAVGLQAHDYIHCILGCDLSLSGEAFAIGFTMGSSPRMGRISEWLYAVCARYAYPRPYRFADRHIALFHRAVHLAARMPVCDLSRTDFRPYLDVPLPQIRATLGIDETALNAAYEEIHAARDTEGQR